MPERIQLSRRKGWRMPPNCVKVDRTTKWGNPIRVMPGSAIPLYRELRLFASSSPARAVDAFDRWLHSTDGYKILQRIKPELRGINLACWCPPGSPCHADVLLRIANA